MTKNTETPAETTAEAQNEALPAEATQQAPEPLTRATLIAAMDAHDAEGERLQLAMAELGLDAKGLKAIRKAEKAATAAREALAKLMGEGA